MKSYPANNDDLVEFLQKSQLVDTPAILEAFRAVDRGEFATPSLRPVVYQNRPVQHRDIHLSAPFIYAEALEAFSPKPGMSFLNIGSGTCYLSYLVSMLVGELGVNHGVERSGALLEHSARCIANADRKLGRHTDIQVLHGNGLNIATDCGYDCVYVGAGCDPETTADYFQGLLNVGGVLVAPFGEELVRIERMPDGTFSSTTLCNVVFSPLVMPPPVKQKEHGESTEAAPPALRFVVRPWSPACHGVYPESFRSAVMTVLMANSRANSLPSTIPPALWMEIMSFARRDWFSEDARNGPADSGAAVGDKSASGISHGCLGAAKSMALLPVKAGSAAATQIGCHVS